MRDTEISVSILSADLLHLQDELEELKKAGADQLHFDVMDGQFVPNISFGLPVLQAVSKQTDLFLDVHLMIQNPLRYIENFANAGADLITFHLESADDPFQVIPEIRKCHCKAGISIKPGTPAKALLPFLDLIDVILVMTVEPGFGGQSYLHDMTEKIREIYSMIQDRDLRNVRIEVDGGIDSETAPEALQAGADILVSGSYLFRQNDMKSAMLTLKNS
ncbi:MAG: ribulose-phosphate 3-epimerase [Oscillospiraceae bacterium]|nr:ribulose-phosphate 3-epimerase [Oscillospiraceae bacterium]MDE5885488.1 ribulose-phosphate 3-epimerase [Oscillospiraceae bacterium]